MAHRGNSRAVYHRPSDAHLLSGPLNEKLPANSNHTYQHPYAANDQAVTESEDGIFLRILDRHISHLAGLIINPAAIPALTHAFQLSSMEVAQAFRDEGRDLAAWARFVATDGFRLAMPDVQLRAAAPDEKGVLKMERLSQEQSQLKSQLLTILLDKIAGAMRYVQQSQEHVEGKQA
ncbi:hypothetical protein B0O99DRAFT_690906 [Bisporella sp. PMI_857]|nr:hypothetical protein B0O99DRAFT_690906 [Bisporella sp. PMI_857]